MFLLANIKATTSQKIFQTRRRKHIKFELNRTIKKHPFPSYFVNFHEIKWETEISFPEQYYNQSLPFEIYEKHQFGYNPSQLNDILQGHIKIEKDATSFTCEIVSVDTKKIVGYLSGKVRHKEQAVKEIIQQRIAKTQLLLVNSIVAHIPLAVNKKMFFKLNIGKKQLKTSTVKSFCGDLVFAEPMHTDKLDIDTKGILSIWQRNETTEIKLGEGTILLTAIKPQKKVTLFDLSHELLGEAYVDSSQQDKEEPKTKSNSLPVHLHKIIRKDSFTRTSMSRASEPRKLSITNPNQSIVFSTQKRFKDTANSQLFSPPKTFRRTKMPLSQLRANRIVNKANQLSVILEDETPGVGQYVLPSIWDRY